VESATKKSNCVAVMAVSERSVDVANSRLWSDTAGFLSIGITTNLWRETMTNSYNTVCIQKNKLYYCILGGWLV